MAEHPPPEPRRRPPSGPRRRMRGRAAWLVATAGALAVTACSGASTGRGTGTSADATAIVTPANVTQASVAAAPTSTAPSADPGSPSSSTAHPGRQAAGTPTSTTITATHSHSLSPVPPPAAGAPVIVIDPGHSRTVSGTDPSTGLNVADYENEPEMRDVFAVAELVRAQLLRDGYRVVLTKTSVDQRRNLGQRADIANAAHAALALSIHDQAGANGGIGFRSGNNIVYYQSVGNYRTAPDGHRVTFTDARVAALSKRYGAVFAAQRRRVQGVPVTLLGNTGYNLSSRGLPAGNIWIVQLLAKVPWIYNEAGGNSAGQVGLSPADEQTYADSLVASVEHCIPPPR